MSDEQVNNNPVDSVVAPVADLPQASTEATEPTQENQPATETVEPETPAASEPVAADPANQMAENTTSSAPVQTYYHGKMIVEKLEEVTAEGRLCKFEDGTTSYVPLSILGE